MEENKIYFDFDVLFSHFVGVFWGTEASDGKMGIRQSLYGASERGKQGEEEIHLHYPVTPDESACCRNKTRQWLTNDVGKKKVKVVEEKGWGWEGEDGGKGR